jgi:hypothetical protein
MPYVFAGSAASAAWGLGMLAVGPAAGPAVRFAVLGAATELTAKSMLLQRLGDGAKPYQSGRAGKLMEAGEVLTAAGLSSAVLAGRSRAAAVLSGLALLGASACTRFGVFEAGRASARDPAATVGPAAADPLRKSVIRTTAAVSRSAPVSRPLISPRAPGSRRPAWAARRTGRSS